jgi:hypothetical protein
LTWNETFFITERSVCLCVAPVQHSDAFYLDHSGQLLIY